ncbi:hypothetical protein [Rhodococcus triatomae]|nr:hypothetical protein G419_05637 [Rhodococcus triatomae BKS 15-14]
MSGWVGLGDYVDAGQLYLADGVPTRCAQHCARLAETLREIRDDVLKLPRLDGLGTLPSAVAVAEKINRTANGGDYSMADALADHIAEVEAMQALFEKIHLSYSATQDNTVSALTAIDPQV